MELMIKAKFYANLDDPGILRMMTLLLSMKSGHLEAFKGYIP